MRIRWLGHASFLIENERGIRIITDPFDETLGYKLPRLRAHIVTVSHEHFDHNYVRGVKGKPVVFKGEVQRESHKMQFRGISSYHDSVWGTKRGGEYYLSYAGRWYKFMPFRRFRPYLK